MAASEVHSTIGQFFPPNVAAVDDALGSTVCARGFCKEDPFGGEEEEEEEEEEEAGSRHSRSRLLRKVDLASRNIEQCQYFRANLPR